MSDSRKLYPNHVDIIDLERHFPPFSRWAKKAMWALKCVTCIHICRTLEILYWTFIWKYLSTNPSKGVILMENCYWNEKHVIYIIFIQLWEIQPNPILKIWCSNFLSKLSSHSKCIELRNQPNLFWFITFFQSIYIGINFIVVFTDFMVKFSISISIELAVKIRRWYSPRRLLCELPPSRPLKSTEI